MYYWVYIVCVCPRVTDDVQIRKIITSNIDHLKNNFEAPYQVYVPAAVALDRLGKLSCSRCLASCKYFVNFLCISSRAWMSPIKCGDLTIL